MKPSGALELQTKSDYSQSSIEAAFRILGSVPILRVGDIDSFTIYEITKIFPLSVVIDESYDTNEWSLHIGGQVVWSSGA